MPVLGEAEFKLTTDTGELESGMARAEDVTKKAGQGMSTAMKVGGAAAGAALGGLSTMVITTGIEFDEMHDSIATATGASGDALKALESDAKAVFGAIPVDMNQAAMAIGEFNTLTGHTGETLQGVSESALNAARMLGEDAAPLVKAAGQAMNIYELSGQESIAMMDELFVASQDTGIGMGKLATQLQTYGPVLKNMNMGVDDSIALFGALHKGGVDVSRVMPAINKFTRELAEEGVTDLTGALWDQFDAIKNAETETEALNLASQAFGAEGAQRLMMAVRTGALDMDDLTASIQDSEGAIKANAEETDSMTEKFKVLTNKAKLLMEPLKGIGPALGPIGGMMKSMGPLTHGLGAAMGGLAGPKGIAGVTKVIPALRGGMMALSTTMLTPPMGIVIAIGAVVTAIILVIKYWDEIKAVLQKYVLPVLKKVGEVFMEIGGIIKDFAMNVLGFLKDHWKDIVGIIMGPLGILVTDAFGIRSKLVEIFTGMFDTVTGIFGNLKDALLSIWSDKILPFFTETIPNFLKDNWTQILIGIFGGLPGIIFTTLLSALGVDFLTPLKSFFTDTVLGFFTDKFVPTLTNIFTELPMTIFGAFLNAAQSAWSAVLGFFTETIPGFFTDNWQVILVGIFTGIPGVLIMTFKDSMWSALQGAFDAFIGFGTSIKDWIMQGLNAILDAVTGLGAAIPGLIWDGIVGAKNILIDGLSGFVGEILDILDPRNWFSVGLVGYGELIPDLVWQGVMKMKDFVLDKVAEWAKGIPGLLGDGLAGGANLIKDGANVMLGGLKKVPGVSNIPGPWSTLSESGMKLAAEFAKGIAMGKKFTMTAGKLLGQGANEGLGDALSEYTKFTDKYKDHLNDWLMRLPEELRGSARLLGEAIVNDTAGTLADTLRQYIKTTGHLGDYLNDWLTYLPEELRPAAQAIGEAIVSDTGAGIQATRPALMDQVVSMTQSTLETFVEGMGGEAAIERLGVVGEMWTRYMQGWLDSVRSAAAVGGADAAIEYTEKLIEMLGENAGAATDALKDMLEELKLVRESELAGALDAETLVEKLTDTIDQKVSEVESTGVDLMAGTGKTMQVEATTQAPLVGDALMQTLGETLANYSGQCSDWGGAVIAYTASGAFQYAAGEGASMIRETGQRLIDGMIAGLEAGKGLLFSTIQRIIAEAIVVAEAEAGTESPSVKFAKIGGEMGEGLTLGWERTLDEFAKGMKALDPLAAGRPSWLSWLKGGGPTLQPVAGGGGRTYQITVNNPRPMAAEDSIRQRLIMLQHLGV